MTNLVPHDIEEWMRTMERNYRDLASRRASQTALGQSTPRWRSTLPASVSMTTATLNFLAFSTMASAPENDVGSPAFMEYQNVAGDHRYVANVSGLYLIRAGLQWEAASADSFRKVHIYKGSATVPSYTNSPAAVFNALGSHHEVTGHLALQAGEYFRIGAYQNDPTTLLIIGGAGSSALGARSPSALTVLPVGAYTV